MSQEEFKLGSGAKRTDAPAVRAGAARVNAGGDQWCSIRCGQCGKQHGQYLSHYEILQAGCGLRFWALRPKKNGPLVLFPHPGFGNS